MNLQQAAKATGATKNDNILNGKEKMNVTDVIAKYPECVTIRQARIIEDRKRKSAYCAVIIDEEPEKFFFGGVCFVGLINNLIKEYNGDIAELNADLLKDGLKVKLEQKRSQFGNLYTNVTIL